MGKNGGEPGDTILTLEEALSRFKRKRGGDGEVGRGETEAGSNVHYGEFPATVQPEGEEKAASEIEPAEVSANASVQRDDASADMSASDIVAVIDGIPRTFEQLEQLAAAELAYQQDFPDETLEAAEDAGAEVDVDEEESEPEIGDLALAAMANRHALRRDYAFTTMGAALMVLFAFLVTHPPAMNRRPNLMVAQSIPTPALKGSASLKTTADDLITTMVIVPEVQVASVPHIKTDKLEAQIKNTLKARAFPDIGVSVSKGGDTYLAGEVYSLNEVNEIAHIVHGVNGVNRVHFLHPDVLPANGPAYFGAMAASAPAVWGAKVKSVIIGSPADKAGVKAGDVISEFDGKTIPDARSLNTTVAQYSPGQRVQFRVWHDGQPEYLVVRLGEATTTVASR